MSYTFNDQLNKLASLLGDSNTDTDSQWPLADRKKEINRGEIRFTRDTKAIREYVTGTVASNEITIPTDWLETHVLIINDHEITNKEEIPISDIPRYVNWQGTPPKYYFWEVSGVRTLTLLGDVNGQTYQLWYFKKPSIELSEITDTSIIPEEYREASVYYAAGELLDQIGKHQIAAVHRNSYNGYVSKATEDTEKQIRVANATPTPDIGDDNETFSGVDRQGVSY